MNMSYVKWIAPYENAETPNIGPPSLCFYLQVPTILSPEGTGHIYITDSSGNVGEEIISLVPSMPVPEPSSLLALFGGLAGIGGFAIRRPRR
jgi:hypothetical protein